MNNSKKEIFLWDYVYSIFTYVTNCQFLVIVIEIHVNSD